MNTIENIMTAAPPHLIYFNDDHSLSMKCTAEVSRAIQCTYSLPSTWQELSAELETHGKFLIFHADMLTRSTQSNAYEFVDAVRTMSKYMPLARDLKIGVVIEPHTPLKIVKDLQKTSVQGIVLKLGAFPIDQVANSVNALVNGIPYWPKEVLKILPGSKPLKKQNDGIQLTHRQTEVFKFITERGSSNKIIARALGISESTVKLHVTEVFKKYGVRSRTQLAVFSNMSH